MRDLGKAVSLSSKYSLCDDVLPFTPIECIVTILVPSSIKFIILSVINNVDPESAAVNNIL